MSLEESPLLVGVLVQRAQEVQATGPCDILEHAGPATGAGSTASAAADFPESDVTGARGRPESSARRRPADGEEARHVQPTRAVREPYFALVLAHQRRGRDDTKGPRRVLRPSFPRAR